MLKLALMSITTTTLFMFTKHPLSMGLTLLLQTLIIAIHTGNMAQNFWYSYIVFIIMIGGMMILFLYMLSVASNEKFKFSPKVTLITLIVSPIMFITFFQDQLISYMIFKNQDTLMMNNNTPTFLSMSKYLMFPSNMIMLFMMAYLLMTLIAVVKITNVSYGPLRQKN